MEPSGVSSQSPESEQNELTAAQRARAERQRAKAKALREARLVTVPDKHISNAPPVLVVGQKRLLDSGGGFLVEEEEAPPPQRRAAPPVAPPRTRAERPICGDCHLPFDTSYLLDTFDYDVCDSCRDDEDAHGLVPRTEAKSEFLLQDCDLDSREPALRCVTRRNPHRARAAPMRLYLRAQLRERAELVWGGPAGLQAERERRDAKRETARDRKYAKELRALRMTVRGSLFARDTPQHEHVWGDENYDADADNYSRVCSTCGHTQTYEKM